MIYKVVLNGSFQGVNIQNVLYYRLGIGIDFGGLGLGGGEEVAKAVDATIKPKLLDCQHEDYSLDSISAYVIDSTTFQLYYQLPYTLTVNEVGARGGYTDGPANVLILRYTLEPIAIVGNGPKPPKRGYFALGPVISEWIDNGGHYLNTGIGDTGNKVQALCDALAGNIAWAVPASVFYPIRVHQEKILGIFNIVSYADISACGPRPLSSFRRSRVPEG